VNWGLASVALKNLDQVLVREARDQPVNLVGQLLIGDVELASQLLLDSPAVTLGLKQLPESPARPAQLEDTVGFQVDEHRAVAQPLTDDIIGWLQAPHLSLVIAHFDVTLPVSRFQSGDNNNPAQRSASDLGVRLLRAREPADGRAAIAAGHLGHLMDDVGPKGHQQPRGGRDREADRPAARLV
jgi:hypothetical protein